MRPRLAGRASPAALFNNRLVLRAAGALDFAPPRPISLR
jgi:hypothetical protein